jgi:hypothetical protein
VQSANSAAPLQSRGNNEACKGIVENASLPFLTGDKTPYLLDGGEQHFFHKMAEV